MIDSAFASRPSTFLRRAGVLTLSAALVQHPFALARADEPASPANAAKTKPVVPAPLSGMAILARAGAEGPAWALAKDVYALSSLRPASLDEATARVLVGDPAPNGASQTVRDLADERASIHGDDGGSRALLKMIASQLDVRAIAVVEQGIGGTFSVRIFLAETGAFDAARYEPDAPTAPPAMASSPLAAAVDAGPSASAMTAAASDAGVPPVAASSVSLPSPPPPATVRWSGAVASLDRAYGANGNVGSETTRGPALATSAVPPLKHKESESHPFYASPWFWGAIGAAAFGGAALYFATRDTTTGMIHLELQVPK